MFGSLKGSCDGPIHSPANGPVAHVLLCVTHDMGNFGTEHYSRAGISGRCGHSIKPTRNSSTVSISLAKLRRQFFRRTLGSAHTNRGSTFEFVDVAETVHTFFLANLASQRKRPGLQILQVVGCAFLQFLVACSASPGHSDSPSAVAAVHAGIRTFRYF